MTLVYGTFAVLGGTVMICQFVMTVIGLSHVDADFGGDDPHVGHGPDAGHENDGHSDAAARAHDSTWIFSIITFRTLVAAATFFGLAGLAAQSADFAPGRAFVVALAAGGAAMYGVHQLMQLLYKLRSDGTARIERAIGRTGTVYLRIPPSGSGAGKVTVHLRDRTVEYLAVTPEGALPTGAKIVVTRVVSSDTVEVEPVPAEVKETSHA